MDLPLPVILVALLAIGFAAQWIAWRVKLPAILFLLLAGLVLGPGTGVLDPDALLGRWMFPFVSLGVAIILFEGSLTLRFEEIRGLAPTILRLVSLGALLTLGVVAWTAQRFAGMDWPLALLFGALVCVTGPTVIVPMLRTVRPNERIGHVLRWEGIIIDPIGALLAVLMFEAIVVGQAATGSMHHWVVFALTVGSGAAFGLLGAAALGALLRRHLVPEYLQNYGALTVVLAVFAASNATMEESGLLAVTVMGIVLANRRDLHIDDILDFKEHLSTLLISLLFVLLAARLDGIVPLLTVGGGIAVLAAAQFVARPLSVLASTLFSELRWRERALLAWIAPRGIVAAAVSALFALKLEALGVPGAERLVPLTFLMIIGTVLLQSATAGVLARWLGVADPDPNGVLIVGAGRAAREIGKALRELKVRVLLADDDWHAIRAARMDNLPTFFGNPVSEHADRHLDLVGIGRLFAISGRRELNALACVRYRPEFGADRVAYLRVIPADDEAPARSDIVRAMRAPRLFGDDLTQGRFTELVEAGWRLKSTRLSEAFGYEAFRATWRGAARLLFALDARGQLRVATTAATQEPKAGWTLVTLVPPEDAIAPEPPAAMAPAAEASEGSG